MENVTIVEGEVMQGIASREVLRLVAALMLAALVLGSLGAAPAHAADGREVNPRSELEWGYRHALGRGPDPSGWATYTREIDHDCRRGVMLASYDLLTSQEARHKWDPSPAPLNETLVGAMYAALLNRAPDPGGFHTWVGVANQRGFPRAVTGVLSSPEYRDRLARICAGRKSTNATMLNGSETKQHADGLIDGASDLLLACGIQSFVKFFLPLRGVPRQAAAVNAAARAFLQLAGTGKACKAGALTLEQAGYMLYLRELDYPVYFSLEQWHSRSWVATCYARIGVGSDPSGGVRYQTFEWTCR
jgi:hypothetical protein